MATHEGNEGIAKIGANTIAEVASFEVSESAAPVNDTAKGDAWETHIVGSGRKSWTASITCHFDETDTNGQEAATINASVALKLYPGGDASADREISGTGSITSVSIGSPENGVVPRTLEIMGNGALTHGAVV